MGDVSVYDSSALKHDVTHTVLLLAALIASAAHLACHTTTLTAFPTSADAASADSSAPADAGLTVDEPDMLAMHDVPAAPDLPSDREADAMPVDHPTDLRPDLRPDSPDAGGTARTLFDDGFDDGFASNWSISDPSDGPVTDDTDGTNRIATLDSSQTEYSRLRCNLDGSLFTDSDLSASMKLRIDRAPTSTRTVRLDVRQDAGTANIFYAVGATVNASGGITRISIFKKVPDGMGDYTECELAPGPNYSPGLPMGDWRSIKLSVSGSTATKLSAFLDGSMVATFTDDCTSPLTATNGQTVGNGGCLPGRTGLGIQIEKGLKASVDDVLVTAP